jgi:hypothetical protein
MTRAVKLSEAQRLARRKRIVKAMYRRWLEDEKILDEIAQWPEPQYSDLNEMLRNLGTAIAYAQSFVTRTDARRLALKDAGE